MKTTVFALVLLLGCDQASDHAGHHGPKSARSVQAADGEVQGCLPGQFLDRSAAGADRELAWSISIGSQAERCMQIVVGQTVLWGSTNFNTHPLDAENGDMPNPIPNHLDGVVTFTAPGTFGYVCGQHPSMKGAIKVVAAAAQSVPASGPRSLLLLSVLLTGAALAGLAGRPFRGARRASHPN